MLQLHLEEGLQPWGVPYLPPSAVTEALLLLAVSPCATVCALQCVELLCCLRRAQGRPQMSPGLGLEKEQPAGTPQNTGREEGSPAMETHESMALLSPAAFEV